MKLLSAFQTTILACALSLFGSAANAQSQPAYPNRLVKIVVAAGAGGTTDFIARIVAQKLTERMGETFVVENRPGAASKTGTVSVAKSAPDGYTLLLAAVNSHAINPHLFKDLGYNHIADFAPISLVSTIPNMLVVNPQVPAKTVPELIALLKANPDKYAYGSTGRGSSINLSAVQFMQLTGTKMTHVPYNGSGQMVTDLVGNQIQLSFDNIVSSLPQVQSGGLRALAVTTLKRSAVAPEIPALAEFLPGFDVSSWHGLVAPAGTPRAIVDRLNKEVLEILKAPDIQQKLQTVGATAAGGSPEEFAKYMAEETERWGKLVKAAGLEAE